MPCPHFKITIAKRSENKSAVAGAAYQSGERLFSEYDRKVKEKYKDLQELAGIFTEIDRLTMERGA